MRRSGILMPIFSLPSPYGIGTFGRDAYKFVDFLQKSGQTLWQILPLNPTNYGDSPYQSFSSFAGNPYFIDIEKLIEEKLITKPQANSFDFGENPFKIDYEKLYKNRFTLLKLAFDRFSPSAEYETFCKENGWWLDEYGLFLAIKKKFGDISFMDFPKELKSPTSKRVTALKLELSEEIKFQKFLQFKFSEQWTALKEYANQKGIKIIGDIPIYVALDSSECWAHPEMFLLDQDKKPTLVAGCPPDAFSDDGQLWGNPLYNWDYMKKDGYSWWKKRIGYALKIYDIVRIDHFRAFEAFYAIPYGDKTAKGGKWIKGPDLDFFKEINAELGKNLPIIAEDLGHITPEVRRLLKKTAFPGMKVLQFAFDGDDENPYLPHNHTQNSVVYIGTHDNDTIIGWCDSGDTDEVSLAKKYARANNEEGFNWSMIKTAMASASDTAVFMMQDFLGLSSDARINTPSTLGGNWGWRIDAACTNDWLAKIIFDLTELYGRVPKPTRKKDK